MLSTVESPYIQRPPMRRFSGRFRRELVAHTLFTNNNVVFPTLVEYSYFPLLELLLIINYSLWHFRLRMYWCFNY